MLNPTQQQLDNRKQWFAALRSGEYRQAQSYLKVDGGYCCLGVAAEVAECPSQGKVSAIFNFGAHGFSSTFTPTKWFAERFGVTEPVAAVISNFGAGMNDGSVRYTPSVGDPIDFIIPRGGDFKLIADSLEWCFALADAGLLEDEPKN